VICLEEPENGIHPERIPVIVRLLRDVAVDPGYAIGPENPLRQVMVNTHSPEVVQNIRPADLVYIDAERLKIGNAVAQVANISFPAQSWRVGLPGQSSVLSPGRLRAYLGENQQMYLDFFGREKELA
jgi:hypothetical protein